jgi:hypothetical protein
MQGQAFWGGKNWETKVNRNNEIAREIAGLSDLIWAAQEVEELKHTI